MMNKIILVTGWNATGKSIFAYKLAERIAIPFFNADAINETVGDNLGPESWEVYKKGNAVTFYLLTHIAERFLQVGNICILERNFIQHEIEEIKNLLEKYSCKCLTYMFNGDLDVLGERYYKRERHWVHSKARDAGVMRRYPEHRKLMDVEIGQMIYVDATSFDKIDYEALYDRANNFLNNE
jgi:predicted kinase